MQKLAQSLVEHRRFEAVIVFFIIVNAVILGLETSARIMANYGNWLHWGNQFILGVFIVEAALKIIAVAPRFKLYFGSGWNLFDFSIIVLSLIPASGEYAMIARLARLLRVARLISTIPELRLIVSTLVRSIPSMGHVLLLMGVIFYIYAVAGFHLFSEHDPTHWGSLGLALLTLFRVVTLEDWTDVMYTAMDMHGLSWIYFVSFVVVGTFVVINLFIAVVINNLDQAKTEQLEALQTPPDKDEILREIKATKEALRRLQEKIDRH